MDREGEELPTISLFPPVEDLPLGALTLYFWVAYMNAGAPNWGPWWVVEARGLGVGWGVAWAACVCPKHSAQAELEQQAGGAGRVRRGQRV